MSTKKDLALGFLAGSLVTGIAAAVAHKIVAQRMLDEFDERLNKEVAATIDHMVAEELPLDKVDISDDLSDETSYEDVKMVELPEDPEEVDDVDRVIVPSPLARSMEKPPLEDLVAKNQAIQYHKIIEDSVYADEVTPPEPEEVYEDPDITVISKDIFMSNISEYDQDQLTYFADGGVLDSANELVHDHFNLIGQAEPPFGSMSDEEDVVYIRNKKLEREFEVKRDTQNASDFLAHSLAHIWNGPER